MSESESSNPCAPSQEISKRPGAVDRLRDERRRRRCGRGRGAGGRRGRRRLGGGCLLRRRLGVAGDLPAGDDLARAQPDPHLGDSGRAHDAVLRAEVVVPDLDRDLVARRVVWLYDSTDASLRIAYSWARAYPLPPAGRAREPPGLPRPGQGRDAQVPRRAGDLDDRAVARPQGTCQRRGVGRGLRPPRLLGPAQERDDEDEQERQDRDDHGEDDRRRGETVVPLGQCPDPGPDPPAGSSPHRRVTGTSSTGGNPGISTVTVVLDGSSGGKMPDSSCPADDICSGEYEQEHRSSSLPGS